MCYSCSRFAHIVRERYVVWICVQNRFVALRRQRLDVRRVFCNHSALQCIYTYIYKTKKINQQQQQQQKQHSLFEARNFSVRSIAIDSVHQINTVPVWLHIGQTNKLCNACGVNCGEL